MASALKMTTKRRSGRDQDITTLVNRVRKTLYLRDLSPLYLSMATVLANRLGSQVWLMLVGPAGCGGTEILRLMTGCGYVRAIDDFSVGGLLSGVSKREFTKGTKGGFLFECGQGDTVLVKDFTSVLDMRLDQMKPVLMALRNIFDGRFVRQVGSDGSRTITWEGRLGMITKCTPEIDKAYQVLTVMGDRFIYYRFQDTDGELEARTAMEHIGWDREEVRSTVAAVMEIAAETDPAPGLEGGQRDRLIACAALASRARTGVMRDRYSREIMEVGESEGPARVALQLNHLYDALYRLGLSGDDIWGCLRGVALGTIPGLRGRVIRLMINACFPTSLGGQGKAGVTVGEMAEMYGLPGRDQMLRRAVEELEVLGVVKRAKQGAGKVVRLTVSGDEDGRGRPRDLWEPSEWLVDKWRRGWK